MKRTRIVRDVCGQIGDLFLELVVYDEDGELGSLCLALGLGQLCDFALYVLLQLRHRITEGHDMISGTSPVGEEVARTEASCASRRLRPDRAHRQEHPQDM